MAAMRGASRLALKGRLAGVLDDALLHAAQEAREAAHLRGVEREHLGGQLILLAAEEGLADGHGLVRPFGSIGIVSGVLPEGNAEAADGKALQGFSRFIVHGTFSMLG